MWNVKYDTNELIYERKTDSDIEDRLVARGKGNREGWIESWGLANASYYMQDG